MTADISFVHDHQTTDDPIPAQGESRELVDVLEKIAHNAGMLLEVHNCSIALSDTAGTIVTLAALQKNGHKPHHTRIHLNEGVVDWVAQHRKPLVINNINLDPHFKQLGRMPIGSIICVPLISDDQCIGTLTASSPQIDAFDARKVQMLSIFAEQAVLVITNAQHAELARRQANQLEMLMHLSHGITTRLEPDALYRTILADVHSLVPCQFAAIYLYQERTEELFPVAEWSSASSVSDCDHEGCTSAVRTTDMQCEKVSLHNTASVVAWAAAHRHPILRAPIQDGTGHGNPQAHMAALTAPFVSKGMLYGVLSLKRKEPFSSGDLRVVRNLSNMAAAALENVELFHKVRSDQEQLRAILASSSDGIALMGADGCFIEANAAFGRIFSVEPEQVVGMECMELLGCCEEDAATGCRDLCMIQRALQQQQALPYIEIDLQIQGASRSVGLSITPVAATTRQLCLLVARDVTAIRDATRMKANFLSMITHELRSPLNAINGYLDLALTGFGGDLSEQQREFMQRARAGSEHLYALVEDLLLVSRADSGQLRLSREIIKLQDVIANAVEEMELTAKDHEISIEVHIAKDFPRLYADAVRLQQVLRNLVSNALRFTSPGGKVTISADVEQDESSTEGEQSRPAEDEATPVVKLRVSDTGSGIALENQQQIFERFYQVPGSTGGRSSGQGLGLAIVKMIVELHGGHVAVESAPEQGSTFTCVLPCLLS